MIMDILPIVMNTDFERLAVIDDYISFIWTTRYYTCGDFELCVDVNETNVDLFQKGYYIIRDDDENAGVIEQIHIQKNEDHHEMLIISGRFLPCILARRIIAQQTVVDGTVAACVNKLLTDAIINPAISARKISNFILGTYSTSQTMQAQYTGDNLLDTINAICQTYGIGYKVILNDDNEFVFSLVQGTDHSYEQSANPYIVFSDEYDNLLSSQYEEDYREIATDVLVAGEGEGLDRRTLWVSEATNTGLDRYEVYKDQRNLQSNGGEISDAEYEAQMRESGLESITTITTAFTGTVYFGNLQWKQDVNIGDICVIENKKWGIYINSRLVEVIESVAESGEYSIVPTFGI